MDQCLPTTGTDVSTLLMVAVAFVAAGAIAVCIARRNAALAVVLVAAGVLVWASGTATAAVDCPPPSVTSTTTITTTTSSSSTTTAPALEPTSSAATTSPATTSPATTVPGATTPPTTLPPTTTSTSTTTTSTTSTSTTSTSTSTTTTETPVPPQAVEQTVTAAGMIAGSLIDDGDFLGTPTATITSVIAVQGPGALDFGVPTEIGDRNGRPCGTITVAADGSYTFAPELPGERICDVQYTLSNVAGSSTALEIFVVPAP
jgi:hypothetical protein